ncbi:MAG: ABC transporter ATP-binding protein/permease, partial [Clostridia bacterium]|nr:ABC transporter ATP-binding protein/permease [Clostridia bacterium]
VISKKEEPVVALKGVSIEFRRNEFVSILGPSGCGKTTLLNIIGGLDRYTSGDIQIDGISTKECDDVDWDTYRNRRIGFVFQSYNLIPHMNILKNVALSLTLAGVGKEERYRRAQEALEKVGLGDQVKKKPLQLSGGQMQRVAIARALVNNPEIILADEPTGALDSESGLQVMDLLREVANDRLVIMVTHNPNLAEEYSTRIVYLKDGQVDGDTMPYDSSVEPEGELKNGVEPVSAEEAQEGVQVVADENAEAEVTEDDVQVDETKPVKKQSRLARIFHKRRAQNRTSMKLRTAISLSWNNLLSKKGRTALTSIAGSIGIIGIVLVLSLSTGAKTYLNNLEENALSSYPLTIAQTNMDMQSIFSMIMTDDSGRPKNPDTTTVYTQKVLGKVMDNFEALMDKNDLKKLRAYIEENFDKSLATVSYNYGIYFNAYIEDPKNSERAPEDKIYMKVNPYTEVMQSVLDKLPEDMKNMQVNGMSITQMLNMGTTTMPGLMNAWCEMSSNQKLLDSQYELVGSASRWPTRADEIVIVMDNKNQLLDYQLFMLGLKSQDDVINALAPEGTFETEDIDVADLLALKYKVLTEADYLDEDVDENGVGLGTWTQHSHSEQSNAYIESHSSIELKVVGVIRPRPGVESGCISGVFGYTEALTNLLIETSSNHPAVKIMLDNLHAEQTKMANGEDYSDFYESVINFTKWGDPSVKTTAGDMVEWKDSTQSTELLRALGVVNLDEPTLISFYCNSFDAKEKIVAFINDYNEKTGENVRYGDSLATIMSFVNTMATTLTGVLVTFASISLVVSTIMIAIIIYTSVLERRKEIGVLRSIGARKKDISRVFLAESAILGAYSGIIGVFVSYLISLIGSVALKIVFGIEGLMSVTWWHCVMMIGISVLLSMLAGFIPSRIAAKKDPAIALRSE